MANQGKETSIEPSLVARIAQGLGYMATGNKAWFGAGEPMQPMASEDEKPSVEGRRFDYGFAINTQTKPRHGEQNNFEQLRGLADAYDILRLVIETRKDQMAKLPWAFSPIDSKLKHDARCDELNTFFQSPDKENSWDTWLRTILEDMFVIDAATLYPRKTLGGKLYALEPVDGATIKRVIDDTGRTPLPPQTAYQQILKGVPAVDYSREELIYVPRNTRTNKVYGFSHVEQITMTVNLAIRRQVNQLSYYTEGNLPNMLLRVPKDWQPSQIKEFQEFWDNLTQGQTKHKGRFIPDGMDPIELKQPPMKDIYDEWLARVVCYCFSIEPTAFVAQVNRATAQTSREQSLSEGLEPTKIWVKNIINRVVREHFGYADIEFKWVDVADNQTLKEKAETHAIYLTAGVLQTNEVRAELGLEPLSEAELAAQKSLPAPVAVTPKGEVKPTEIDNEEKNAAYLGAALKKKRKAVAPINQDRDSIVKLRGQLKSDLLALFKERSSDIASQLCAALDLQKGAATNAERVANIVASLDFSAWNSFFSPASKTIGSAGGEGAAAGLEQVGASDAALLDLLRVDAKTFAEARAAEMVGMRLVDGVLVENPEAQWAITETTRDMLKGLTEQALDGGWSAQELSKAVQDSTAFGESRADMIARTEIAKADSEGSLNAYVKSGVVAGKGWLTAGDDQVSEACSDCEEAGVIGLGQAFPSGAQTPPNHPKCRCSLLPALDEKDSENE